MFEEAQKKNLLAKETLRHRLAYAQAKNPKAMIVSADVMSHVTVGHNLKVTSDKPTFMAINLQNGTYREHKGKLTNIELDKFVRQVESGHLNIVHKLQAHLQSWYGYARSIVVSGNNYFGAIIGNSGNPWGFYGGRFSNSDGKKIAQFVLSNVNPGSLTINGVRYSVQAYDQNDEYILTHGNTGVSIFKTNKTILLGFYNASQSQGTSYYDVSEVADYLLDSYY